MMNIQPSSWTWRFAVAFVLLVALLFTLSTDVRASVLEWVKTIAGFNVEERVESPLQELTETTVTGESASPLTPEPNVQTTQAAVKPTIYSVTMVPLPEVIQNPPFKFGFPQYVPAGYVLQDETGTAQSTSWLMIHWKNQDGAEIELLVQKDYSGFNIPAGAESTREIQLSNREPALLILGFWGENHTWNPELSAALHWQKEGVYYVLTFWRRSKVDGTIQLIKDIETVASELVKMAESVQGK
jgi:hypothetical protein